MPIELYYHMLSAPCRVVVITSKVLGVELNLKEVNLQKGENMTPEFLKLNPQHTIPTMVDGSTVLTESRAMITYLVNKYGKGSDLYPEDASARALVDQRLLFDIVTLQQRYGDYAFPQLFAGQPADEAKLKKLQEALGFLETFLERSSFVAASHLTLADLSIAVTVSNILILVVDLTAYPKISAWLEKVKEAVPVFKEINSAGVQAFKELIKSLRK